VADALLTCARKMRIIDVFSFEDPMAPCFKLDAPKKAVNLSLNSELLSLAKDLGLNISKLAEDAVAEAVKARLGERWLRDHEEAIGAYNERVEAQGVFSDGLRRF